ncbi:glycerol-3-phosphate 1-O-acyltransferase PlsY [Pseudidiomarina terrestris]|uniref:Glycerol-3-phosphate acyltransferase n=1 Tax=Pseudidiomarina terrestris TaxID=2820060 RepID=A0AAW7QXM1_9GAMM|nr:MULTISPECIES: glycerol-3-phosphate 1-O-acyltransferase PlsY [unclassified Pseudidiomarina]MDN7123804.1 glycerol-3-phosphate 1-O-acyltransferase PlsY [Pseudidiomarina sp. 1APP75-32.1]MDN7127558.1 glycerol-3-phosphate 1-O-acyltransferase PlsY [Pseudidiomarina sp. 1APR75-33.1]MDN7130304.1 glycerol-3-phosphate 1-O-acyltransferase PlsY [Pseudidiomarina sp. 1APR75-15]MDN7136227.1 glycerol-3-phosphate 1-O-acyltransferase PlsY [Pseudidiomarina sp. 1ASP75-5]MDN7138856.1 glycerol-3-phosphate 1-O-acyl
MGAIIVLAIIVAYLFGSLSSAVIICKLFRLPDPRFNGSNNPGATNVYRIGGKIPALLTLTFDVLKGMLPVWGSYFLGIPPLFLGVVAVAACLGHIFPLYFQFRGGKAVATALGTMFPVAWEMALLLIATWLLVFRVSKVSSIAALITVTLAPFYAYWIKPQYTVPTIMISILIIWRHQANISRLRHGNEERTRRRS